VQLGGTGGGAPGACRGWGAAREPRVPVPGGLVGSRGAPEGAARGRVTPGHGSGEGERIVIVHARSSGWVSQGKGAKPGSQAKQCCGGREWRSSAAQW